MIFFLFGIFSLLCKNIFAEIRSTLSRCSKPHKNRFSSHHFTRIITNHIAITNVSITTNLPRLIIRLSHFISLSISLEINLISWRNNTLLCFIRGYFLRPFSSTSRITASCIHMRCCLGLILFWNLLECVWIRIIKCIHFHFG